MFDAFKDLAKLKQMQSALQNETVTVQHNGVTVTMRGDFEVTAVELNPELDHAGQQTALLECLKRAKTQMQAKIAQSMGSFIS